MAFDKQVDLLVVGSGAGALVAALRGARAGAEVLGVEKGALWGGTSATSGGGIWIPGSHLAAASGQADNLDEAFGYVRKLTADNVTDEQIHAFVDNSHKKDIDVATPSQQKYECKRVENVSETPARTCDNTV